MNQTDKSRCNNCNKIIETHSCLNEEATPMEGDLSVCLYCANISQFDKDLNLIPLTEDDLEILQLTDTHSYQLLKEVSEKLKLVKR